MANHDRGLLGVFELTGPARFVCLDPAAQLQVAMVELGAHDLEPGIGEDLARGKPLWYS